MAKQIKCRDCGANYREDRVNCGIVTTTEVDPEDANKTLKHVDTSDANCKKCGSGNISIRHHNKIRNKPA